MAAPVRKLSREAHRRRIHVRMRKRVIGTPERPRLCVHRSTRHIRAQVIDDTNGRTLVSASTIADKIKTGGNLSAAKEVGKLVAERAKEKGITQVVYDRGGYLYHGRVKALADAAREGGLEF